MTGDESLEAKISSVVNDVGESSPPAPPFPAALRTSGRPTNPDDADDEYVSARPGPTSRPLRGRVAVGVLAAFVIALGAVALLRTRDTNGPTVSGTLIEVMHQVIDYQQSAEPTCPDASQSGTFDSMTFETWADPASGRWRQDVRYPDGSIRSVIVIGNPAIPTEVYNLGGWDGTSGTEHRCGLTGIMLAEPGQNSAFFLDLPADTPAPPNLPPGQDYRDPDRFGQEVTGNHSDSLGRPTELWEKSVSGFDDGGPLMQKTSWFIDPASRTVLERHFVTDSSYAGTYEWTATLVTDDLVTVDSAVFDTSNYQRLPDPPEGVAPTTTVSESGS